MAIALYENMVIYITFSTELPSRSDQQEPPSPLLRVALGQ